MSRFYSLYEPEFLDEKKDTPMYTNLSIRLEGYDFVIVESFAKYIDNKSKHLGLQSMVYAVPARTTKVQIYKPNTSQVGKEYDLALYKRVVQVSDLPSTLAPIFFEVLNTNLPPAVSLVISPPTEEEEDYRYVPDLALLELQAEIAKIEKAKEERKKK
ncbi:hypothetical protein HELRODRAFT_162491 [Helobdella robusta]|uniref:Small ribosomal subunit protein uS10 domain-containing protein n=1 Tax=Helobdella robusta TaxID=6412 RepID=T1ESQ9_HELRO|nr:hypothetical protein HELRODRAFT_162491 [Helobdella robusta]ESN99014.1 hypothetical protein HELRODRAFT_162491 [Helobdella robusta]